MCDVKRALLEVGKRAIEDFSEFGDVSNITPEQALKAWKIDLDNPDDSKQDFIDAFGDWMCIKGVPWLAIAGQVRWHIYNAVASITK